jgi:hypothetical protein
MSSTLVNYLAGVMMAWYPLSTHAFTHKSSEYTQARYKAIAADLEVAAFDPSERPLFADPKDKPKGYGRLQTAMAMLSWAGFESGGFAEDVDSMTRLGDGGTAKCLMQVHSPYKDRVFDRISCFREGLHAMHDSMAMCKEGTLASRLAGYTVGRCVRDEQGAQRRLDRAKEALKDMPFLFLSTDTEISE